MAAASIFRSNRTHAWRRGVIRRMSVVTFLLLMSLYSLGQRITGTLRGEVADSSGNVVVGAKVVATNQESGVSQSTVTNSVGTYIFPEILPGVYTVSVSSEGFSNSTVRDLHVATNVINDRNVTLAVGGGSTTIDVSAAAETVDLTSSTISTTFSTKEALDIPSGTNSPLQLSLFSANTTAQQGGVVGTGGSVAGSRPRNNSFTIDGVDDNNTESSGSNSLVIQDAVAEFNLVTNPFSAEYGHAGAGQFNIVTKSGTNNWHGSGEYYLQNRFLNALDNLTKSSIADGSLDHTPRLDISRVGGTIGGPILKNRWFVFGAYEYYDQRADGIASAVQVPTAAGLTTLEGLTPSSTVAQLLKSLPSAPSANAGNVMVDGFAIPTGVTPTFAANPFKEHDFQINSDYKAGKHQLSGRFLYNHQSLIFAGPIVTDNYNLPGSFVNYKAAAIDTWSISNTLVNDLRASYSHSLQAFATPAAYASNPTIFIAELSGLQFGAGDPQRNLQNVYQLLDTQTKLLGRHTLKYGVEGRHYIAPTFFLPRSTGNYFYSSLQGFINDEIPDIQAIRGAGDPIYKETQSAFAAFVQDDIKVNSRLTLNVGLRYEFTNNPADANTQALNAISSVPGVIDFHKPKTAKLDFEPRLGFAWDPTGAGKTSVRGGIGVGYSPAVNNFDQLAFPPQVQTALNIGSACNGLASPPAWCATGKDFFANGALPSSYTLAPGADTARALTQAIIPDAKDARTVNWSLGVQQEVYPGGVLDVRYVGSRSFSLPVQLRLNSQGAFTAGLKPLPTYFNVSEVPAAVPTPASTQQSFIDFENNGGFAPYSKYGFFNVLTDIGPYGSSIYHGASVSFTQSLRHGLTIRGNYTWSHNIDNATNELNSSAVNPRRPEDSYDLSAERSDSSLDVRHKVAVAWTYDSPKVGSGNTIVRFLANGYQFNGAFVAQTGQPVTILSPYDTNANGDTAGDRATVNPHGSSNTSSDVWQVCANGVGGATSIDMTGACDPSMVVGYVAADPKARYIATGFGSKSDLGRNSFLSPGFGIWNMSLGKSVHLGETRSLLARVEAYNVFNHRNFTVAGPLSVFSSLTGVNATTISYVQATSSSFLDPKQFSGGSRAVQVVFKFIF